MKQQQLHQELKLLQSLTTTEILNGRDENNSPYLKLLFEVYQALFKEVCTSCPTKISGYITRIKKFKFEQMAQSNFTLKDQATIVIPGTSLAYSNANLTDEVAIKFIKENPNRKILFSKLPKNLDELINGKKEEKKKKDLKPKKVDLTKDENEQAEPFENEASLD